MSQTREILFFRRRVFEFELIFSWRTWFERSTFWFSFNWESCSGEEMERGFWRIRIRRSEVIPMRVIMNAYLRILKLDSQF